MSTLYGDVFGESGTLSGEEIGKHQVLIGTDNQDNFIFGDAYTITDSARGGNDALPANGSGDAVVRELSLRSRRHDSDFAHGRDATLTVKCSMAPTSFVILCG